MIEFTGLILGLFAWMAVSLWLAAVFRMPIQVDSRAASLSRSPSYDFERGDTSSSITCELENAEVGVGNSDVFFNMKRLDGSMVIERAKAEVICEAEAAKLLYKLAAGDTDEPGLYEAQFEVASSGSSLETHRVSQSILVRVAPKSKLKETF